jgi:hypothetical protein
MQLQVTSPSQLVQPAHPDFGSARVRLPLCQPGTQDAAAWATLTYRKPLRCLLHTPGMLTAAQRSCMQPHTPLHAALGPFRVSQACKRSSLIHTPLCRMLHLQKALPGPFTAQQQLQTLLNPS